jgi:uncharacterized membrane protein YccC
MAGRIDVAAGIAVGAASVLTATERFAPRRARRARHALLDRTADYVTAAEREHGNASDTPQERSPAECACRRHVLSSVRVARAYRDGAQMNGW